MDGHGADRRRVIGAGAILAGVGMAAAFSSRGESAGAAGAGWQPAPESPDSWLDKPGTRHRMVLDTTSGDGGREAIGYAIHFIYINERDYGLTSGQLGTVIIFRHGSTPFGYNNAVWAKYGATMGKWIQPKGDVATPTAIVNPLLVKRPASGPPAKGLEWAAEAPLTALAAKGVRFAVCGLATEGLAQDIAGKTGSAKAIEAELKANLVPGALVVPAGVVALNRAQEHGYTFASSG